jgi:hypothetical protein
MVEMSPEKGRQFAPQTAPERGFGASSTAALSRRHEPWRLRQNTGAAAHEAVDPAVFFIVAQFCAERNPVRVKIRGGTRYTY